MSDASDSGKKSEAEGEIERPKRYAVRIWPRAYTDIEIATVRLADLAGDDIGIAWYKGLPLAFAQLTTNPQRFPVIAEQKLFRLEARQMLYRRPGAASTGPAHRIIFTIKEVGDDGPIVHVFHVRHASAKPITRKEAREIQAGEI